MELSARNRRTLTLYLQVRATGGACLVGRMRSDPIVRKNMGILGWLFDQYDRDMTATSATLRKR